MSMRTSQQDSCLPRTPSLRREVPVTEVKMSPKCCVDERQLLSRSFYRK